MDDRFEEAQPVFHRKAVAGRRGIGWRFGICCHRRHGELYEEGDCGAPGDGQDEQSCLYVVLELPAWSRGH